MTCKQNVHNYIDVDINDLYVLSIIYPTDNMYRKFQALNTKMSKIFHNLSGVTAILSDHDVMWGRLHIDSSVSTGELRVLEPPLLIF